MLELLGQFRLRHEGLHQPRGLVRTKAWQDGPCGLATWRICVFARAAPCTGSHRDFYEYKLKPDRLSYGGRSR
eukprot:11764340-Prorocentrum_lima.AAC.1